VKAFHTWDTQTREQPTPARPQLHIRQAKLVDNLAMSRSISSEKPLEILPFSQENAWKARKVLAAVSWIPSGHRSACRSQGHPHTILSFYVPFARTSLASVGGEVKLLEVAKVYHGQSSLAVPTFTATKGFPKVVGSVPFRSAANVTRFVKKIEPGVQ